MPRIYCSVSRLCGLHLCTATEHKEAAADLLYRMQRFAEGRAYLEAAIAARPGDHEIAFNLGAACYALGDLVESERWFIEAVCTAANEAAHARALTQMAYPVLAEANLRQLGCSDVAIRIGDGSRGWREHAPYDRALLTAAAERLPPAILDQIKPGGRIVLPLGPDEAQRLTVVDKGADGQTSVQKLIPVRFSRLETVV
jgi:tetratricopeptide (TPR) repeat protein